MPRRLIVTTSGLWLSVPGVDVIDAIAQNLSTDHFLIAPNYKSEQFIAAGTTDVGPNASAIITYGTTYSTPPAVLFQAEWLGLGYNVPFFRVGSTLNVSVLPNRSGFTALNGTPDASVRFHYQVISRTLP